MEDKALTLARKAVEAPPPSRECGAALEELAEMLTEQLAAVALREVPRVLDTCVARGAGDGAAVKALWKLARAKNNQAAMFAKPGVVEVVLHASDKGGTPGIKESGFKALVSLSAAGDNKVPMFATPGLVDVLMRAAAEGETSEIKRHATWTLANLAYAAGNKVPMFTKPGMVDLLVRSCGNDTNADVRFSAVNALRFLSASPDVCRGLDTPAVVAALSARLNDENEDTHRRAMMALANIVGSDEKRSHMLSSDAKVLGGVVDLLKAANHNNAGGWTHPGVLQPICSLCMVPSNRSFFVSKNLTELVIAALDQVLAKDDARSVELAVSTLQQLAFDDPVFAELKQNNRLLSHLDRVVAHTEREWEDARRAAQFLTAKLSGKLDAVVVVVGAAAASSKRRLMVSYSWSNQDLGRRVDSFFTSKGCDVWRDERNMSGNIVDAMMKGVMEADFVVCLISDPYFKSSNCRAEFEFAKKQRKTIVPILVDPSYDFSATWIGFHLGNALYYTVTLVDFDGPMGALYGKEIDVLGGAGGGGSATRRASRRLSGAPPPKPPKTSTAPSTPDDVRKWLASVDLDDLFPVLEREGFADKRFARLRDRSTPDLMRMFDFKVCDADDLFEALKAASW